MDTIWWYAAGTIYLAILMVLVRPNSKASATITTLGNALTDLVKTATAYKTPVVANDASRSNAAS